MDLAYMPEVFIFGSFRSPVYRDYEQPWNQNYFNYGKSSVPCQRQGNAKPQVSKHNCHFCKESKRRSLGAYIRGKPRLNSCSEISEEDEEESTEKKTPEAQTEKVEAQTSKVCKEKK